MTVADLIRGAFRVAGVLASGESPTGDEQADALVTLNDMLGSWANEQLLSYATVRASFTLTAGHNPHTLGAGGNINTARPLRIERASIVPTGATNTENPLVLLSDAEWQAKQGKATTGAPAGLWIDTAFPLMSLYLNPIPAAADAIVLYMWLQPGTLAVTNTLTLPPGYARALRYNLAKELAPEYGVQLSAEAADVAVESKAWLKRLNDKPSYLRSDAALLHGGRFNIITGG